MTDRHPGPRADARVGAQRRVLSFAIVGIAIVVLIAAAVSRTRSDGTVSSVSGCGDDFGGPSALVNVDSSTGALRWSRRIGERPGVAQLQGVIAAIGVGGEALGIDTLSGAVKWCRELGAVAPDRAPLVQPGFVAGGDVLATLAADGHVIALDPATGTTRWDTAVAPSEGASLVGGSVIYVMGFPTATSVPADPSGGSPAAPAPGFTADVIVALDASTGAIVDDAPPPPPEQSSPAGVLITSARYSDSRQEMTVGVRDPASESDRWSKVVPGFTASIIDDAVLVFDQTGGTGDVSGFMSNPPQVQTVLTAYSATDGTPLWHIELPGAPNQPFGVTDGGALIANGPQILSIDLATGAIRWTVDHGSPGVSERYSEPGNYRWFAPDDVRVSVTGLIVAAEPYHD